MYGHRPTNGDLGVDHDVTGSREMTTRIMETALLNSFKTTDGRRVEQQ